MERREVTSDVPDFPIHSVTSRGEEVFFQIQRLSDAKAMINPVADGSELFKALIPGFADTLSIAIPLRYSRRAKTHHDPRGFA
jgi:hypothetical protein